MPAGAWPGVSLAGALLAAAACSSGAKFTAPGAIWSSHAAPKPLSAPVPALCTLTALCPCKADNAGPPANATALQKHGRATAESGECSEGIGLDMSQDVACEWPEPASRAAD